MPKATVGERFPVADEAAARAPKPLQARQLERLSLCGCSDVTDRGVLTLLSACARLADLRVSQTAVTGVCFIDQSAPKNR